MSSLTQFGYILLILPKQIFSITFATGPTASSFCQFLSISIKSVLKVFTNENRGGVRVISFDRPPFKLLSRKFSKESGQAHSVRGIKPLSEHLFLLFANNY
jgi:hypothetical protein